MLITAATPDTSYAKVESVVPIYVTYDTARSVSSVGHAFLRAA